MHYFFLLEFVIPFMNDVRFVGSCDKNFPCKIILFCEEIFLAVTFAKGTEN